MVTVYLGLGSNMGDREGLLRQAVEYLTIEPGVQVERVSSIYETAPVGYTDQDPFLNAVAVLATTLTADQMLRVCLEIEHRLNRQRYVRWGPRTIDMDILLFGEQAVALPELTVPHPRMKDRLFVLIPLQEVAPELAWNGKTVTHYIQHIEEHTAVKFYAAW